MTLRTTRVKSIRRRPNGLGTRGVRGMEDELDTVNTIDADVSVVEVVGAVAHELERAASVRLGVGCCGMNHT